MADWLARVGAATHAPSRDDINKRQHAKQLAQAVQQMMVDIVIARNATGPTSTDETLSGSDTSGDEDSDEACFSNDLEEDDSSVDSSEEDAEEDT
eukprot:9117512-Karenia_brevis.AAC.1